MLCEILNMEDWLTFIIEDSDNLWVSHHQVSSVADCYCAWSTFAADIEWRSFDGPIHGIKHMNASIPMVCDMEMS